MTTRCEACIRILHFINPNISVSSELFSTNMNVFFKDDLLFRGGYFGLEGFLLGMIEQHKIQQKN